MSKTFTKTIIICFILFIGIVIGVILGNKKTSFPFIKNPFNALVNGVGNSEVAVWDDDFKQIDIASSIDNKKQKSYFYPSKSKTPQPLIVSLHTWSGNYRQNDDVATLCKKYDVNYIHPDFRGANIMEEACCSKLALSDIDDAITYAIKHANIDTSKIYVMGLSGGGYATLSTFMKSKHNIKKFSAWASITDLIAWYNESKIRNNKYAQYILDCTGSGNTLNIEQTKERSPLYWETPIHKLNNTTLSIYAGVYDGIQGSVPITHSINFYNKLLRDLAVTDSLKYVSLTEKLMLLEHQKPLGEFGHIDGRKIILKKEYANVRLIIFEGNHEMLTTYALKEMLEE